MPIELKMPALSPTMEEGTLAKWLVKEGDTVSSGDLLAEIETDKATMEFEAVDEGTVAKLVVPEGTDGVKVGAVIALLEGEGGQQSSPSPLAGEGRPERSEGGERGRAPASADPSPSHADAWAPPSPARGEGLKEAAPKPDAVPGYMGERVKASPLARKLAKAAGLDLNTVTGTGPGGRIVKADVEAAAGGAPAPVPAAAPARAPVEPAPSPASTPAPVATDIPHTAAKLSNMRKTIARRLTESKATVPHIYLTVDVRLDALLKVRAEMNAGLANRGVKLSVNDLLIKALAVALIEVPKCNVSFAGDQLISYGRADISVAVSVPGGLITPVVVGADAKSLSQISREVTDLAGRAREGKLQPHEYQGGTASISNMGMYGITQFDAVINPPQGMILAVGAGEKRPVVDGDSLGIATVMSATGSFDHRAIDGADGAELMRAFKGLCESPLGMLA